MTTPVEQPNITAAATAAYLTATATLRTRLLAYVAAVYAAQGDYRDAAAAAFVASVVPAVQAAQQTMASLTSAYLAHLISSASGGSAAPAGIPLEAVSRLRGIDAAEVYRRPYVQVWTDLSHGKPFDAAVVAGERRATNLAVTDLQLAKTHSAREVFSRNSPAAVIGYRRELGGDPHHCALCLLTSSRIYHKAELMPIHPGCSCSPMPVFAGERVPELDPATVHDAIRTQLGDKYVNASGGNYRDIVVTHDHGELGPVLAVRGQQFTGPPDVA